MTELPEDRVHLDVNVPASRQKPKPEDVILLVFFRLSKFELNRFVSGSVEFRLDGVIELDGSLLLAFCLNWTLLLF